MSQHLEDEDFEDEIECDCMLDEDDEFEYDEYDFDEEEEKPKKKKAKAPAKTVESLLEVLRNQFDEVLFEAREDDWFPEVTFQHLECRNFVTTQENKNPNIVHEVWLEVDISNSTYSSRHKEYLEYIANNMKMLRSEDIAFFEPKKMVNKGGISTMSDTGMPSGSIHERHSGMIKPTANDFVGKMKSIISYVFENAPLDKKNDRFGRFDDYWFDTEAWRWVAIDKYPEGIEPIVLFQLFAHPIRAYLGPRFVKQSDIREEEYVNYWIWSDMQRTWNDRNGFSHKLDLINETDIIDWLYNFTGWPRKEHDLYGDTVDYVVNHLRNREIHEGIENWYSHVESLAKKARNPKELKAMLTDGVKYDANGGFGGGGFLCLLGSGGNYCLDHKIEFQVKLDPKYAKYIDLDVSQYSVNEYSEDIVIYDAKKQDIWEYVHGHFNPKPVVLDLFSSMFDDSEELQHEEVTKVEATIEAAFEDDYDPFSLFEDVPMTVVKNNTSIEEENRIEISQPMEKLHTEVAQNCGCVDDEDKDFNDEDEGCGCYVDYDDDEELVDDENYEDEPKKKKKKSPPETVESLLSVLNNLFDEVTFVKGDFYKQTPDVIDGIASQTNSTYWHLTCSMFAPEENKNPNILYWTWLDLKIRAHHDFPLTVLKKVVSGYEMLVKNEDIQFFKVEDATELSSNRVGLNYYLLYEDRKLDPIPSYQELVEMKKSVIAHIFQNGVFEEGNPRLGNHKGYSISHYKLEKPSRLKEYIEERGGIDDITLHTFFSPRVEFGKPKWIESKNWEEGGFWSYPYYMDGLNGIKDANNNVEYSYKAPIDKEFIQWLREFTGLPEKTYKNIDDVLTETVVHALRVHHNASFEQASFEAICKNSSNPLSLREELKLSHDGREENFSGTSCRDFVDYSYTSLNMPKGQMSVTLKISERVVEYFGWDVSTLTKDEGYRGRVSYQKTFEMYSFVWELFNPKPKVINLLSIFDDESIDVEPANNYQEPVGTKQLTLF